MGLTTHSVGTRAVDRGLSLRRPTPDARIVALCGNPNVGKSTVFNALTGMHQHTGNWTGKTVTNAQGICHAGEKTYLLVDIPGTYSLAAHSAEEEVARDFICFGESDAAIVVCDATALERNLNLVLQILEVHPHVVVCVNLMDEAKRRHIDLNLGLLQDRLGIPVIATIARKKKSLSALLSAVEEKPSPSHAVIPYPTPIELALAYPVSVLERRELYRLPPRWIALKLLEGDPGLIKELEIYLDAKLADDTELQNALKAALHLLQDHGIDREGLSDLVAAASVEYAEELMRGVSKQKADTRSTLDRRLDRVLTGRITAYPVMLLLLALIFWLTVSAANVPSGWLASGGEWILAKLSAWLLSVNVPPWLHGILVDGILLVLFRVISVMLPPMAIFFPLFTLLEDAGVLPRIAYNLDRPFARCRACGKQALTMCMGFGCNAAGVVGCRIIDSPRERLLAILTNSFVPCNGRFPALISILTLFFIGTGGGLLASLWGALLLCGLILLGILATLGATKLLSHTLLRGMPSSFVLEMPPYRMPEIGRVLVRSVFDRTLFVLGRAIAVAAPAGLIIWGLSNTYVGDISLLAHGAAFLDPFAHLCGMDGVILIAFILGLPANEIVIPLMLMAYSASGKMSDIGNLADMREILIANGWTWQTAVCVLIFFLMHAPCATTLMTIKKETGKWRWTLLAAALPTVIGLCLCFLFTTIMRLV